MPDGYEYGYPTALEAEIAEKPPIFRLNAIPSGGTPP